MICVSDGFTSIYPDRAAFMRALADQVNIEFRRKGARNLTITDVLWRDVGAGNNQDHPIATICAAPGGDDGLLTLERVRDAYAECEKRRRALEADDQGRLI